MRRSLVLAVLVLPSLALVGCQSNNHKPCAATRVWADTAGEGDERARIALQWAKVRGTFDSVMGTREGKSLEDRSAGSTDRNQSRYRDSIILADGVGRSLDGCVDWRRTWLEERFDRLALAGAFLRRFAGDTAAIAIEVSLDSTSQAVELVVEAVPGVETAENAQHSVRFALDSTEVRLVPK